MCRLYDLNKLDADRLDFGNHFVKLGSGAITRPSTVRLSENKSQVVVKLRSENDGLVEGGYEHIEIVKDACSVKCEIDGWRVNSIMHYELVHEFEPGRKSETFSLVFMTCQEELPENSTQVPNNVLTVAQISGSSLS